MPLVYILSDFSIAMSKVYVKKFVVDESQYLQVLEDLRVDALVHTTFKIQFG